MLSEFEPVMSANLVMMLRADVDGAIWLVDDQEEGRFYERVAHEKGRVVPAFGSAVDVLRLVVERGAEGVICLPRKMTLAVAGMPIYWPDLGDVASLLVVSRGADRVLGEIGGAAWLTACGREIGPILQRAAYLATVLEHLSSDGLVREDQLAELVDWRSMCVDWQVASRQLTDSESMEKTIEEARALVPSDDLARLLQGCNGMNVVRVLAAATKYYRPRGIQPYRSVSAGELLSLLRTGFDLEEIETDGVYWRLKEWEWANWRYPVFRHWRRREPFNLLLDQSYFCGDLERLAGSGLSFAAFQLDLDHFKNVNEKLGHLEGDEAIKMTERLLLEVVGGQGCAYRRGGDELAAVLVGVDEKEAMRLGEHLRAQLEKCFREWAEPLGLAPAPTASIGVACVREACSPDELVRQLEAAQGRAKKGGKNRVEVVVMPVAI